MTQDTRWRFCVAPMLDWTDSHCRVFHRALSRKARLYTEMITSPALVHGDRERLLAFNDCEHPVACQLGGSDPAELAEAAKWVSERGYDEVNLNCGCPSERVQRGSFGACLMLEPKLVADCFKAMRDAVDIDVTIKHRIGVDDRDDYGFVRDFVGVVKGAFPKRKPGSAALKARLCRPTKGGFSRGRHLHQRRHRHLGYRGRTFENR